MSTERRKYFYEVVSQVPCLTPEHQVLRDHTLEIIEGKILSDISEETLNVLIGALGIVSLVAGQPAAQQTTLLTLAALSLQLATFIQEQQLLGGQE